MSFERSECYETVETVAPMPVLGAQAFARWVVGKTIKSVRGDFDGWNPAR